MRWFVSGKTDGVLRARALSCTPHLSSTHPGLAVIIFCLGLIPRLHTHLVIIATSWIGATALTLGIDCFARTGLKESYIYNLGYYSLFPSLNGYRYPLLVVTQVMLGVIAAWFVVSSV
jgi:hypothetical protein